MTRAPIPHARAASEFKISSTPDAAGFYKLADKIVKDNGRPDCVGSVTPVGDVSTNCILFHRDRNHFLLCRESKLATCIGPYVRVKATDH